MNKQKGQQNINTPTAKCWPTEQQKNNVNRETQVLKAIINQTRSIGNEFLVINIKAEQGPGQSRLCAVVQGCTRRFSPAGQNQHQQSIERTPSTTLSPSPGMEMKIDQTTTTTSKRWKKESQQAYIFAYLFIRWPEGRATWWRPLLLTGKNVNKKYGFNFTPVRVWCRAECGPGFAATVSDD